MRKHELFCIHSLKRRYDKRMGKFIINIAYETAAPEPTDRVVGVAEAFGLGLDKWEKFIVYYNVELRIGPADIVYITGDSGSGKSVLLRTMEEDLGDEAININSIEVEPDKPIIETVGKTFDDALTLLSRVGLNDAYLFIRRYSELSDGQKYRYKLAKLIESNKQWWIMDEFCSILDRDTAKIVAFNVQKMARTQRKAVVAATTHRDLLDDLKPSVHIHKSFGDKIEVDYYPNRLNTECSLVREMRIEEGTYRDYMQLSMFHYRSKASPFPRKIFTLMRDTELCGVIVYSHPPMNVKGRKLVWRGSLKELRNELNFIKKIKNDYFNELL